MLIRKRVSQWLKCRKLFLGNEYLTWTMVIEVIILWERWNMFFFQFQVIMQVLINSFRFIWITNLCLYDRYKYPNFSVRGRSLYVRRSSPHWKSYVWVDKLWSDIFWEEITVCNGTENEYRMGDLDIINVEFEGQILWQQILSLPTITYFRGGCRDFLRQNLTSVDVRFWRIKTVPALKKK